MRVVYLSGKKFPASTADHIYVRDISRALALESDFTLVVAGDATNELSGMPVLNRRLGIKRGRAFNYFFWLPKYLRTLPSGTAIISNDPLILIGLVFWRHIYPRYRIVSDWHVLFGGWKEGVIARASNRIIVTSEGLKDILVRKYSTPESHILSAPNGVDLQIFGITTSREEAREQLGLPHGEKIVTYTGRFKTLGMDKGLKDAFKALHILGEEAPLLVAAGGREEEVAEYQALAKKLDVEKRVRLVGNCSQHELALYARAADALLMYFPDMPHYRSTMSPMKMFEYMAAERPIIASDLPTVRSVLNEQNAYLLPPESPEELAHTIRAIWSAPALARSRASAAHREAQSHTWHAKARMMLDFIRRGQRILYIANVRLPTEKAYGRQIMETCAALGTLGAEVKLLMPYGRSPQGSNPFAYYGVARTFTIEQVRTPQLLRFGFFGFILGSLLFAESCAWRRDFWQADVIYSRDASVLLDYLLLGHRFIYEAHAAPARISRLVARSMQTVVVITKALADAYARAGIPRSHILIAPDAVDAVRFDIPQNRAEARQKLGWPEKARIALYAGHLYPRKGVAILAEAARKLPDVLVYFAGGTDEDISAFTRQWGSEQNIRILGHRPATEVPLLLRAADVLVLPNLATDEDAAKYSSPMKLYEYVASGTPIVASDVSSAREVLSEETAYFVPAGDPPRLADCISHILAHPAEAKAIAQRAQAAGRRYSWIARAREILDRI